MQNTADLLSEAVMKAMDVFLDMSINRSHANLELLISRWRTETHIFVTSWESSTTLENVLVMFRLLILADRGEGPCFVQEGEREGVVIE